MLFPRQNSYVVESLLTQSRCLWKYQNNILHWPTGRCAQLDIVVFVQLRQTRFHLSQVSSQICIGVCCTGKRCGVFNRQRQAWKDDLALKRRARTCDSRAPE
jgi:hypothetical protein